MKSWPPRVAEGVKEWENGEKFFFFPDCIEQLAVVRGHERQVEELDDAMRMFSHWDHFVSEFIGREVRAGRHDTALYGAYYLVRLEEKRLLQRVHFSRNYTQALEDGDTEVLEMTREFARTFDLELPEVH